MDWKLELIVVPVADVDRAKAFYVDNVGFDLHVDHQQGDFRVVQLTPRGSACSIAIMANADGAGSVHGLHLVVSDIDAARAELDRQRREPERGLPLLVRSPRAGAGSGPRRLQLVLLILRPRRQHLARPGSGGSRLTLAHRRPGPGTTPSPGTEPSARRPEATVRPPRRTTLALDASSSTTCRCPLLVPFAVCHAGSVLPPEGAARGVTLPSGVGNLTRRQDVGEA